MALGYKRNEETQKRKNTALKEGSKRGRRVREGRLGYEIER